MKFPTIVLALSGVASAQFPFGGGFGGGPGGIGDGWGFAPSCAQSCFSSVYSTWSAFSGHCTSTASIASCVSSACPSASYATISSLQSSLCSAYSGCATSSAACTTGFGPWGGSGWGGSGWGGSGWEGSGWGGVGTNGWYTVTASNGQTGLTTATVTVTTTEDVDGVLSTLTVTSKQVGTLVAADVAGATATSSTHNAAATLGSKQSVEALVIVGMVIMVAL
ncbi:hypothetical protein L207DRAFT_576277 [Hyaloscypha variabilis F]|uniref:Extracellular membrane protein CFEM domain-containing protein n=1 Tax=Hyaloscypha variabilis (strain UAMH 11265 / GT02V1 / F) TaxID=1149755 RepID=A0A2J6S9S3_HYAVF|nr:hypothetical protein L207DRAFT_576277 [Hyaloscypha variabilis F]